MSTAVAPAAPLTPAPVLLTAEEFARRHGGDSVELIDGRVEPIPMAMPRHGNVCFNAAVLIGGPLREQGLGAVCTNDSFVLVARNPDRVRGADIAFWPTAKLPGGRMPDEGMILTPPDLVVEVVSPTNTWVDVFTKVGEYLTVGVVVVVVLDPDSATASTYRPSGQTIFRRDDVLELPDVLPGLAVPVAQFFE